MKNSFTACLIPLFIFMFLIFFNNDCYAQEHVQKQKSEFWKHTQFGGGIGLSFGSGFFGGTLAPSGIYRFNNKFATGTSLNLSYNSEKDVYESFVLGASIVGLYNVIPQLQFSLEFEELYISREFDSRFSNPDEDYWYPGLYIGAGFQTGSVTFGIKFDTLHDENKSVYASAFNPFMRLYF